jgi:hypothetical protein
MKVFWDTRPRSLVGVDLRFTCAPWWWTQYARLKRRYTSTRLHGATSQKTHIFLPNKKLSPPGVEWTQNSCELRWPLEVDTWEAGGDRKTIAQRERQHNPFLVLYDVKQVEAAEVSQRRTAVGSKCFQLYYTCSDRLLTIALPLAVSIFPLLLWRFLSSQLFCVHHKYCVNLTMEHTRYVKPQGWN